MTLPEVIVAGDIELLFLGMAVALGAPRLARRALEARYGTGCDTEESKLTQNRDAER